MELKTLWKMEHLICCNNLDKVYEVMDLAFAGYRCYAPFPLLFQTCLKVVFVCLLDTSSFSSYTLIVNSLHASGGFICPGS